MMHPGWCGTPFCRCTAFGLHHSAWCREVVHPQWVCVSFIRAKSVKCGASHGRIAAAESTLFPLLLYFYSLHCCEWCAIENWGFFRCIQSYHRLMEKVLSLWWSTSSTSAVSIQYISTALLYAPIKNKSGSGNISHWFETHVTKSSRVQCFKLQGDEDAQNDRVASSA